MEVTVILRGSRKLYGSPELTVHRIAVAEDLTIAKLIDSLPTHMGTVAECASYFSIQNTFLEVRPFEIQYVITNEGIRWNPSYEEVRVEDFINTVGLDQPIYILTGLQLGGGLSEIESLWPYINLILQLFSYTKYIAEVLCQLYSRLRTGKAIPAPAIEPPTVEQYGQFLSLVFDRKYWNPHELAAITGMPLENARKFVQACSYQYESDKMLYVATENTEKLTNIFNRVDFTPLLFEQQNRDTENPDLS